MREEEYNTDEEEVPSSNCSPSVVRRSISPHVQASTAQAPRAVQSPTHETDKENAPPANAAGFLRGPIQQHQFDFDEDSEESDEEDATSPVRKVSNQFSNPTDPIQHPIVTEWQNVSGESNVGPQAQVATQGELGSTANDAPILTRTDSWKTTINDSHVMLEVAGEDAHALQSLKWISDEIIQVGVRGVVAASNSRVQASQLFRLKSSQFDYSSVEVSDLRDFIEDNPSAVFKLLTRLTVADGTILAIEFASSGLGKTGAGSGTCETSHLEYIKELLEPQNAKDNPEDFQVIFQALKQNKLPHGAQVNKALMQECACSISEAQRKANAFGATEAQRIANAACATDTQRSANASCAIEAQLTANASCTTEARRRANAACAIEAHSEECCCICYALSLGGERCICSTLSRSGAGSLH
ncbi:hypothetical protein CYMTET_45839 [Cymbomonas tetramitiformis]|uniref:Uncharacterized protein n=1 Tax=Cymbomonas tetramitiformis TaxID=36881 RepID=A0AAE0BZ71_9CHLO|nr:hypothetical protein CYMTET_45841 [Cymbomonas tetramitiformis]KAK3244550.1 hypothetical protein CYMTET_45839 [Cymbomonas tetramitiformis]